MQVFLGRHQGWIHSFFLIFKFNFKFTDFKKLNSNSLTLKKLNSNSLTLKKLDLNSNLLTMQKSNSNSSIPHERIQIQNQSNSTFHPKDSKITLQFFFFFDHSKSQMCISASQVRNKPTTQIA